MMDFALPYELVTVEIRRLCNHGLIGSSKNVYVLPNEAIK